MMRHSTKPPNTEEAARIVAAKEGPCVPCTVQSTLYGMPEDYIVYGCDYDHKKSGNVRRGHMFGFASCLWHHRSHPILGTHKATRERYGPSLMDGSALFRRHYGTNDELIELQSTILKERNP